MPDDILDSLLNLEENSYREGFEEGKTDGDKAGYKEGLVFGIEKGYEKTLEMGKLHGRAVMLNACLTDPVPAPGFPTGLASAGTDAAAPSESRRNIGETTSAVYNLPLIPSTTRLKKHIETLLKLTDVRTISVENSDEAVSEFDDRLRKAVAKSKVIDKLIAEPYNLTVSGLSVKTESHLGASSGNIEELSNLAARR